MNIVVIDNYDSFVFNLVHYLEDLDCKVTVVRNDRFDIESLSFYDKILLSPGPGIPSQAGLLKQVITTYAGKKPIFGVCLGLQAIAEVFGGTLSNLPEVFHGVATKARVIVKDAPLFKNLGPEIITAIDTTGQIMSLRHRELDIRAVQFHPESVLTPQGKQMIQNWVAM